ncbi:MULTISPECIES: hypothetical protein [Chroococcidiopsis]|nr:MULTISPECIES: hypothetical protein [Chroococcidiopsis]
MTYYRLPITHYQQLIQMTNYKLRVRNNGLQNISVVAWRLAR